MTDSESMVDCPKCGAMHGAGASFCEECGTRIKVDPRAKRRNASKELRDARKSIGRLRTVFWIVAIFSVLQTIREWGADPEHTTLIFAVGAGMFLLFVAGATFVHKQPVVWGLVLASLITLWIPLQLFIGGLPFWSIILAVMTWLALVPVMGLRRVLAENPELVFESKRLKNQKSSAGPVLLIAVPIFALCVVAFIKLNKPPQLVDALEDVADDWPKQGYNALLSHVESTRFENVREGLEITSDRFKWPVLGGSCEPTEGLARLKDQPQDSENRAFTGFAANDTDLWTEWRLENGEWLLRKTIAPLAPVEEQFLDDWNNNGLAAAAQYYRDPEKGARSLQFILDRNELKYLPKLKPGKMTSRGWLRWSHEMESDLGPFKVSWQHLDNHWLIASVKPVTAK